MASGYFSIYSDAQDENAFVAAKNVKSTARNSNIPKQAKRAALGTLNTNVTNVGGIRKQPSRAAKQVVAADSTVYNDENVVPNKTKKVFAAPTVLTSRQPFTVHSDCQSAADKVSSVSSTTQSTSQPVLTECQATELSHQPLLPYAEDSPMVLDTSIAEDTSDLRDTVVLFVQNYDNEIYTYLRECEIRHRPKPGYMNKQPFITQDMRRILVDWLIEVSEEYKLHRETTFLAVNYIDRFLSVMSVQRDKLQLVGAACMFIASKYEEIYPPEVREFVYITDDTYTKRQVLRMEHLVLKVLSFFMSAPTANVFCERALETCKCDEKVKAMAMYIIELSLLDVDTHLKYLPSLTASAAICLGNMVIGGTKPWTPELESCTEYTFDDLLPCIQDMHTICVDANKIPQQAIQEKYKHSKYFSVSTRDIPPIQSIFLNEVLR